MSSSSIHRTGSYWCVSSIDGRYAQELTDLQEYVSEAALNRYRIQVESAWLLELSVTKGAQEAMSFGPSVVALLKRLSRGDVPLEMLDQVKFYEKTTNHDVKAVEYTLRDAMIAAGATPSDLPWVHFACTSEDINNLSYALILKDLREGVLIPIMTNVANEIYSLANKHKSLAMLSRTHGQSATPTTLGKEMAVFVRRLERQITRLKNQEIEGKINGAVGNFNAHVASFPGIDWLAVSRKFVESSLGLSWNPLTTQIENHDSFVEYMQIIRHYNVILLDFSRDMWGYISLGYFAQKSIPGETGSSTMPHKVNPIYYENAEGNIGVANALLVHFGEKLPVSRFQRDLSDSTVLRTQGTAVGHSLLAWKSLLKGISRVDVDPLALARDLNESWEVLGEAVQTVMRRYGVVDAYERLKTATRGERTVTRQLLHDLIDACVEIPDSARQELKKMTPSSYVGLAETLVSQYLKR